MSDLQRWLKVLLWTQFSLVIFVLGTSIRHIVDGDVFLIVLDLLIIACTLITTRLAYKQYREIR